MELNSITTDFNIISDIQSVVNFINIILGILSFITWF